VSVIKSSLDRSLAVVTTAYAEAMRAKEAGLLADQMVPAGFGGLGLFQDQSKDRRRYGMFEGWLYSAINALAQDAAAQPVFVGRLTNSLPATGERAGPSSTKMFAMNGMPGMARSKAAQKELEILEDHELVRTLEQPNPVQTRLDLVYTFVSNVNLVGRGYIIYGEGEKRKMEYWSLPTTWVNPVHEPKPFSKFVVRNPDSPSAEGETFDRSQVGFAQLPDPINPLKAFAPAAAQISAIRIDDHIQTSQERFFQNGIFPSVVITVGKDASGGRPKLTGEQRRQLYSALARRHMGTQSFGLPAVVDG